MNPRQFEAIYNHLIQDAEKIDHHKLFSLNIDSSIKETPLSAVIYLPMYSSGKKAHIISPMIAHLKTKDGGDPLTYFNSMSLDNLESICGERMANGKEFSSYFCELYELKKRARQIQNFGGESALQHLVYNKTSTLDANNFNELFSFLKKFTGIAEKAALHILMDLGWPVVKPDRHIQRILFRLGGWNDFFDDQRGEKILGKKLLLSFQKKWFETVKEINKYYKNNPENEPAIGYPSLGQITSRQVDLCLMWYSQDKKKGDTLLAEPRCSIKPACIRCNVPNCNGRPKSVE